MSRHSTGGYSYSHGCKEIARDHFRIWWVVDFYYPSSRLRHPRRFTRDTDAAGAERFKKKWNLPA